MRLSRLLLCTALCVSSVATVVTPAHAVTAPPGALDTSLYACPPSRLLDPGFTDDDNDTFVQAITCIENYGIARGKTATTYDPASEVLRQQMALFLWNFLDGAGIAPTDTSDHGFTDLPPDDGGPGTLMRNAINSLANAGIVKGKDSQHFGSGDPVRRDQMATFLTKAQNYLAAARGASSLKFASSTDYFSDDNADVHQDNINAIAAAGITSGKKTSDGYVYDPATPVRRDQMAGFLARMLEFNQSRLSFDSIYIEDQAFRTLPWGDVTHALTESSHAQGYAWVDLAAGQQYDVALFPCTAVDNGNLAANADPFTDSFRDDDHNGLADALGSSDTGTAKVTTVDDAAVTPTDAVYGVTSGNSGQITVVVDSSAADCTVPVLFRDDDGDKQLKLNSVDQPVEHYGAAAQLRWVSG